MKEEKSTKGVGKYEYDLMWILEEEEEKTTTTTTILIPVKDSECSCLAVPTPPRLKPLAQRNSRRVSGTWRKGGESTPCVHSSFDCIIITEAFHK